MKTLVLAIGMSLIVLSVSCDMRSGTAKDEMEKFNGPGRTPTAPAPTEAPIDPADVVEADADQQGDNITINGYDQHKSVTCTKMNRVLISGGKNVVTVKGPCRQIMINGDDNKVNLDAAFDITLNGGGNEVEYSRYVNGKRPVISDNGDGNSVEKVAFADAKKEKTGSKPAK